MPLAFFDLIEERILPHLRMSYTKFRKPMEVSLKLAVTLRHLSIAEAILHCSNIRVITICKFDPKVCQAILEEFQQEYLICPTDPEEWRSIEEKFEEK